MRCIFCKKESSNSKSVEHIIPESIGSKRLVLPKGVVCDKCNNYFANKIENPLLSHPSFRNIRAWYQVPNKKGRMPSVLGEILGAEIEISLKLDENKNIVIEPEKERHREILNAELAKLEKGDNFKPFVFKLEISPPQREMSRFLAKMALEFFVYRLGRNQDTIDDLIDLEYLDSIREYARKGQNVKHWTYNIRRIYPVETMMEDTQTGELVMAGFGYDLLLNQRKETYFVFIFYGVEFAINLGGPSIDGYKEWLELNHYISPIIERNGAKLTQENIDGENKYVIRGIQNPNVGRLFDKSFLEIF